MAGDEMDPPGPDVAPNPGHGQDAGHGLNPRHEPHQWHGVHLSGLRPEVAGPLAGLLAAVDAVAGLGEVAGGDLDGREAAAVAAVLAHSASRLGVTQARMLPVVEADGLWTLTARSLKAWVAGTLGVSVRAAHVQVQLGRELRDHLPATGAAAAAGQITVEHAQVLARLATTSEQRLAVLADPEQPCNEGFLVRQATMLPVDQFRALVGRWAAAADPDADDRGYVEACDREHVTLDRLPDGYHLRGFLSVEHGQALTTALQAVTPVPAAGDTRTSSQRRAQALGDLATVVLQHGLTGTGRAVRPRIGVLVSHETMQNLVDRARAAEDGRTMPVLAPGLTPQTLASAPQFEDGTPVPRALLDRLACDGELNRYVFGPQSEILDVGRAERTFTGVRRSAIIARDKHCRYPGCTAPPAISECHHVRHWSRDHGDTSVANGILLCWYHHDRIHQRGIEIHRRGTRWIFTDAHGTAMPDLCTRVDDRTE